jgi:hypothetical protein
MLEAMLKRRMRETLRCRSFLSRLEAESAAAEAAASSVKKRLEEAWLAEPLPFAAQVHRILFGSEPDATWAARASETLAYGMPRVVWLRSTLAEGTAHGRAVHLSEETLRGLERREAGLPVAGMGWYLDLADHGDFILGIYRRLLGRDGSPEERGSWAKRVRVPFFGRRMLIRKLARSGERRALLARKGNACEP